MTTSSPPARGRVDRLEGTQTARSTPTMASGLGDRIDVLKSRLEARADHGRAEALRADVREARAHVRNWDAGHVSQDTAARYGRTVETMRVQGHRPEDAASKATFEFRRAALVHQTRAELKAALRALDSGRRAGDADRAADAYARVQAGIDTLRRYPPGTGDREQDLKRQSAYRGPSGRAGHSKRDTLDQLPAGWRDDVQRAASEADRPALAAMSLTGCRPAETKGIRVNQDADTLTLTVRGAKVDEARGVESRETTFDKTDLANSQAGRDLLAWLGSRQQRTVAHSGDEGAFAERIGSACERAGHAQASAYSFRHQAARDLRLIGANREELAARLGHRSERSQSVYG